MRQPNRRLKRKDGLRTCTKICSARSTVGGCSRSQRLSGVHPHSSNKMHSVHFPRGRVVSAEAAAAAAAGELMGLGGAQDDAALHSEQAESSVKLSARPSTPWRCNQGNRAGVAATTGASPSLRAHVCPGRRLSTQPHMGPSTPGHDSAELTRSS